MKARLEELKRAPSEIAPDGALVKERAGRLIELVLEDLVDLAGRRPEGEKKQALDREALLERARACCEKDRQAWESFWLELGGGAARSYREHSWLVRDRLREALGLDEADRKRCEFFKLAMRLDALAASGKRYWKTGSEMIARIAEAYFDREGGHPALSASSGMGLPQGSEAEALCALYDGLLGTVSVNAARLSRRVLAEPKEPAPAVRKKREEQSHKGLEGLAHWKAGKEAGR